ncbi:MAG TPA: lysylphosphatidylglycerol synthase transmembrane domain-containing protein [Cyclobacteriaceae bacterium]|nr:lysylphosphatidylglycerol synthase transmembrane domain-containing protein [Cyclobacteriaceae bacterium]
MPKAIRTILQYVLMLGLTAGLLWLSLRALTPAEGEDKWDIIWAAWNNANKGWLILMAVVAYVSHFLRAERWRMLLVPSGNEVSLMNSFYSLMIGYLVNLAVPRGGEVSRCYNLYKLENTPVEVSFGTVVVERIADVLCLLAVIVLAFIVEWDKLIGFLNSLGVGSSNNGFHIPIWIWVGGLGVVGLGIAAWSFRKNEKLQKVLHGFKEGLLSVFQLKRKGLFLIYSVLIWVLYFGMSYTVIRAFDTTDQLGLNAVLAVFALGAIAMAAPLPGGAGSYHTIVPAGLVVLYQLPQTDAVAFVFIFHAWQTFTMIVGGVVSLIISYLIIRWKKQPEK